MTILVNDKTKELKEVKDGFSWTTLFFNGWVPLIRGDFYYLFIMWIVRCITFGVSWLVFPFIYNKLYVSRLINKKGFRIVDVSIKDDEVIYK